MTKRKLLKLGEMKQKLHNFSLGEVERQHILLILDRCAGNRTAAALVLDIGLRTLQRKLRGYGVALSDNKACPPRTKEIIGSLLPPSIAFKTDAGDFVLENDLIADVMIG